MQHAHRTLFTNHLSPSVVCSLASAARSNHFILLFTEPPCVFTSALGYNNYSLSLSLSLSLCEVASTRHHNGQPPFLRHPKLAGQVSICVEHATAGTFSTLPPEWQHQRMGVAVKRTAACRQKHIRKPWRKDTVGTTLVTRFQSRDPRMAWHEVRWIQQGWHINVGTILDAVGYECATPTVLNMVGETGFCPLLPPSSSPPQQNVWTITSSVVHWEQSLPKGHHTDRKHLTRPQFPINTPCSFLVLSLVTANHQGYYFSPFLQPKPLVQVLRVQRRL